MTDMPRRALVTGGANGIGAAVGALLVREGIHVTLIDRDPQVEATAERIGATGAVLDVTDRRALDALARDMPNLDVLVTSAAIAPEASVYDPALSATFSRTLEVNVVGIATTVAAVLPLLRRSAAPRVLTIGSVQGFSAAAGSLAYASSKAAVHNLTRALAVDLAPHGILVNSLAPGFIDTAMARLPDGRSEYETDWFQSVYIEHGRIPLRRPASPDEVAEAAEYLVSIRNSYVTGAVLPVDGGLSATF